MQDLKLSRKMSEAKISGHQKEKLFQKLFGGKVLINKKIDNIDGNGISHSLKSSKNIQFLLANNSSTLENLGNNFVKYYNFYPNFYKEYKNNFQKEQVVKFINNELLKNFDYQKRYDFFNFSLSSNESIDKLTYYESGKFIVFNMKDVIEFLTNSFKWRSTKNARLKGDFLVLGGNQYITVEVRYDSKKNIKKGLFIGANCNKGEELIDLMKGRLGYEIWDN